MSRPRLTRRGEVAVLLATAIALALCVASLRYRWVQAYAIAGAAVLGIFAIAAMAAVVLTRAGELLARAFRRRPLRRRHALPDGPASRAPVSDRHTNPATALTRPSEPQASDPRRDAGGRAVRNDRAYLYAEISPEAVARIQARIAAELDELADRRRRRSV